jgi:hypothetical protein
MSSALASRGIDMTTRISIECRNPKLVGSKSFLRYEQFKFSRSVSEFLGCGGTVPDLLHDMSKGFIRIISSDGPTKMSVDKNKNYDPVAVRGTELLGKKCSTNEPVNSNERALSGAATPRTGSEMAADAASRIGVGDLVYVTSWGREFTYIVEHIPYNVLGGYVQLKRVSFDTGKDSSGHPQGGDGPQREKNNSGEEAMSENFVMVRDEDAQAPVSSLELIKKAAFQGDLTSQKTGGHPAPILNSIPFESNNLVEETSQKKSLVGLRVRKRFIQKHGSRVLEGRVEEDVEERVSEKNKKRRAADAKSRGPQLWRVVYDDGQTIGFLSTAEVSHLVCRG